MKIEKATDFPAVFDKLRHDLSGMNYNLDLKKMLKNIQKMVDELSKQEVEARRNRSHKDIQKQIESINSAIDHLEKLILIAQLMR